MTLKIERINYETKEKLSSFDVNFNKKTSNKALKSVIDERLSPNEYIIELSYNGKTYKGFEYLPLELMKNGDTITLLIDQEICVDVYQNGNNFNKPYRIICSSMNTTEELSEKVKEKLPFGTSDIVLTNIRGEILCNGVSLAKQGVKNNSKLYYTVKPTGG